jgi:hypothetical protein
MKGRISGTGDYPSLRDGQPDCFSTILPAAILTIYDRRPPLTDRSLIALQDESGGVILEWFHALFLSVIALLCALRPATAATQGHPLSRGVITAGITLPDHTVSPRRRARTWR